MILRMGGGLGEGGEIVGPDRRAGGFIFDVFFHVCFGVFLDRFLKEKGAPRVPQLAQKSIKTVSKNTLFQGTCKGEKK